MQQVIAIQDLESVLNEYGELIIRKTNKDNVVVMSLDEYKKINTEIEEKLLKSEEDIENGRTRDAVKVFEELEEKYGFWKWNL